MYATDTVRTPQGVLLSVPLLLPLSGHEFPFSIQMSHVMQTLSQRGEGKDAAAASVNRQVTLQMEQLQAYKHCQFILKPRPTDALPLPAGHFNFRVLDFFLNKKGTQNNINCGIFRAATKAIKEEAFIHRLGLLERFLLSPGRPEPRYNPRLSVRPAAQLRLYGGRSAQASYGESLSTNVNSKKLESSSPLWSKCLHLKTVKMIKISWSKLKYSTLKIFFKLIFDLICWIYVFSIDLNALMRHIE